MVISIGSLFNQKEVNVSTELTLKEVFDNNGFGGQLSTGHTVVISRANTREITIPTGDFSKTLSALNIQEDDFIQVTENHKAA